MHTFLDDLVSASTGQGPGFAGDRFSGPDQGSLNIRAVESENKAGKEVCTLCKQKRTCVGEELWRADLHVRTQGGKSIQSS